VQCYYSTKGFLVLQKWISKTVNTSQNMRRIVLVAGESSGDAIGAKVIMRLKQWGRDNGVQFQFDGIGG